MREWFPLHIKESIMVFVMLLGVLENLELLSCNAFVKTQEPLEQMY